MRRKLDFSTIFCENSSVARGNAREHILRQNLIPYICGICGNGPEWRGSPMPLLLDHINGVNNDHRLENLRFICSNCDTQLPTYKSRNRKKGFCASNKRRKYYDPLTGQVTRVMKTSMRIKSLSCRIVINGNVCRICKQTQTQSRDLKCGKCRKTKRQRPTKIAWPSNEELGQMLSMFTADHVGTELGVSGRAVRQRCQTRKIPLVDHRNKK